MLAMAVFCGMSFWRLRSDSAGELCCEQTGHLQSEEWIGSRWIYTPVVGCCVESGLVHGGCKRVDVFVAAVIWSFMSAL